MSLLTNLVSYWKLDEASGNALDSHSTNTLTENGTGGIASVAGKIVNARDFEFGDVDYFSLASNADVSLGDEDFTWAAWVNLESKPGALLTILSKYSSTTAEYALFWYNPTDRFAFECAGAGGANDAFANNFGAPTIGEWNHVVCWHDSVNNLLGISVNAGTADTVAYTHGVGTNAADFTLGKYGSLGFGFDGLIDEVGLWKRVLTSQERTDLYNGGAGLSYDSFGGGGGSGGKRRRRILLGAA